MKIGIIYGSSTGNASTVAETIANKLADFEVKVTDVSNATVADLEGADALILGTSTWGFGDLQDDWEGFLPQLQEANIGEKTVALFGLGDSDSYPDTFCDGMHALYEVVSEKGCKLIGSVSTDGYTFDESKSVVDGQFVGLAINEDGESDMTEERVDAWVNDIKGQL